MEPQPLILLPQREILCFPLAVPVPWWESLAGRRDLLLCLCNPSGGHKTISVSEEWRDLDFFSFPFIQVHLVTPCCSHCSSTAQQQREIRLGQRRGWSVGVTPHFDVSTDGPLSEYRARPVSWATRMSVFLTSAEMVRTG